MGVADYLEGLVWFLLDVGAVAAAAAIVTRRAFGQLRGCERVLAFALLVTAGIVGVHLLAGMLGILARGSVAVIALLLLAACLAWSRRAGTAAVTAPAPAPEPPPSTRAAWALAVAAAGLAALYVLAFLVETRAQASTAVDALMFQLPGIARWIQDGSVWPIHYFAPGWAFGNYPGNGELVQLSTLLPWRTDAFLRVTAVPFMAMGALGTYALARELRAPRAAAAAAGAVVVAIPTSLLTAVEWLKPDPIMLGCFMAGTAFLVRHARTRDGRDLVLAALGLGLAFGTKWYGVAYVALVLALWAAVRMLARERVATVARDALLAGGIVFAAGGFWLVRNLVGSGNPVFPAKVSVLGVTVFDAPPDRQRELAGFSLADYATDPAIWDRYILPALRSSFALGGALAAVALVAGAVYAVRRRRLVVAAVAVAGLALLATYAVLPYTAQGPEGQPVLVLAAARYAVPGLALGAAVGAALSGALGRWSLVVPGLALVAVLDALAQMDDAGLAPDTAPLRGGSLVIGVLLVGAAFALAWLTVRRPPAPRTLAAGAAAAAVVVAAGAYVHLDRYTPTRFAGLDPSIDYVLARAAAGHDIGVLGTGTLDQVSPIWPVHGPRLENHVAHLGRVERHLLRPLRSEAELRAAIRSDGYDLLYVMRDQPREVAPEERWARSLGWRPVARGPFSSVLVPPGADGPGRAARVRAHR